MDTATLRRSKEAVILVTQEHPSPDDGRVVKKVSADPQTQQQLLESSLENRLSINARQIRWNSDRRRRSRTRVVYALSERSKRSSHPTHLRPPSQSWWKRRNQRGVKRRRVVLARLRTIWKYWNKAFWSWAENRLSREWHSNSSWEERTP